MKKSMLLVAALLGCGLTYGQTDSEDEPVDFHYEVVGEIDTDNSRFSLDVAPLDFNFTGSFLSLGLSGGISVDDIAGKFSLDARYAYNYGYHKFGLTRMDLATEDYLEAKTSVLDITLKYTIKKEISNDPWNVTLRRSGNTEYVSNLPNKAVYRYNLRAGISQTPFLYNSDSQFNGDTIQSGGVTYYESKGGNFTMRQNPLMLTLGFERKTSANHAYKTDKYGVVHNSVESILYGDLLLGIKNNVPTMFDMKYENIYYPDELTSQEQLSEEDQGKFEETLKKLPVGLRVGLISASRRAHGLYWNVQLSVFPGYYVYTSDILNLAQLRLGIGYRFTKLW